MFAGEALTLEKAENISRWYFRVGFLCPMLWLVNALTFGRYSSQSSVIHFNVSVSALLFLVSVLLFFIWYAVAFHFLPKANIWVIFPGQSSPQNGLFANAIYNDLGNSL